MSNELIFYTQIASILTFVGTVFVLYKLLVSQKDATIEALRERIATQQDRMAYENPDALNERLSKRITLLSDELARLSTDKETNADAIKIKEEELTGAKEMYERLQKLVMHTSGMSITYFCPVCNEPTLECSEAKQTFFPEKSEYFRVAYRCGYSAVNGVKASECRSNNAPLTFHLTGPARKAAQAD
jgi:hypothetical protein